MYTYSTFGSTALPTAAPIADIGTGQIWTGMLELPGNVGYDPWGDDQARRGLRQIHFDCMIKEASASAAHTKYAALEALLGDRAKLYRKLHDDSTQWLYSRLIGVQARRVPGHTKHLPLTLTWETGESVWNGAAVETNITLDASPKSAEVTNSGNGIARDIIISVTALGAPITQFDVENLEAGHVSKIRYSGSIAVGEELVIDCGALSVLNDGSDDSDNLDVESAHEIDEWLRLMSGANTIRVTRTGGNTSTIATLDWYHSYL